MDIDIPAHFPSWADQMDLEGEIPPLDQIDPVDALPTQEQIELEYTQPATPPVVHEASRPSPPPPVTGNVLIEITPAAIPYDTNSPVDPDLWDGQLQALFIFGTQEVFDRDAAHITLSLEHAATYIRQTDLDNGDPNTLSQLNSFGTAAWNFILAIYQSKWDHLLTSDNIPLRVHVSAQFKGKHNNIAQSKTNSNQSRTETPNARVSKVPPPIPPHLPANIRKRVVDEINEHNKA